MKIVKYNKLKEGQVKAEAIVGGGGGGSSTTIEGGGGSVSLDREIWGQKDTGDDIDGSMTVNGDVRIQVIDYQWEDDDDEEGTGDDVEYEEGGGNLFVDLTVKAKDLEVTDSVSIGKHLYINHSHNEHTTNKMCVSEILKNDEVAIAANATEISGLKTRMTSAETSISNNATEISALKSRVSSAETNISNNATNITNLSSRLSTAETSISTNATNIAANATEIENIKNQMADGSSIDALMRQIETLKYGDLYNPVILYSGVLSKLSTSDIYTNNGCLKDCLQFTITDITQGLMTIELTPRYDLGKDIYCYVRSVDAIQEMSDDTKERKNYYKERSNGAHWFESWFEIAKNKTTIYLREMHNGNDDNDTWYSSSWFENGGIRAVNLTVNGYISFLT